MANATMALAMQRRTWSILLARVPCRRHGPYVLLLVFLSTFPVLLPFVFIADPGTAKRASAAVAIAMLFPCGHAWGRYAGLRPWPASLIMVRLGVAVESVVIALGG